MKRFILALTALITMTVSASAMSYQQARDQALFLTDKMAYELNLTDEQYEAAYEINLDYLMRIDNYDDLYGSYWRQRNMDLSYILLDWQYRAYCAASYFYRPLYWDGGYWHFGIYARYPHRDYFYFGCPDFFWSYRGGHSWHMNGGRSWYHGRSWAGPRDGGMNPGMRNRFDGGHFGQGYRYQASNRTWSGGPQGNGNMRPQGNNRGNMGGNMGNRNNMGGNIGNNRSNTGNRSFGNLNRGSQNEGNAGNRTYGSPRQSSTRTTVTQPNNSNRTFGNRLGNSSSTPSRTFSPQGTSNRSFGSSSAGRSSAPSMRSQSAPSTRSSAPSSSSRSFGGHSSSNSGGGHASGNSGGGGSHFGRR